MEKYIKSSSFTERIEKLEAARERMKLLLKSVSTNKQNISNTQRTSKSKALSSRGSSSKRRNSYNEMIINNCVQLEKQLKLKENEIQLKIQEIKQCEEIIMDLKIENDKNKNEIADLNDLVSKYATEKFITDPAQYNNALKPKLKQGYKEGKQDMNNKLNERCQNKIQDAKISKENTSLEYSPGDDVDENNNKVKNKNDENSFKLEMSNSIKNPFGGAEDQQETENEFEISPFINEDNRKDDDNIKNNKILQNEESNALIPKNKGANRKKWDLGNNSKNINPQANLFTEEKNDSGEDEDDSSFIINFNDLESPGKFRSDGSNNNELNKSIVGSQSSQVKLDLNNEVNFDTNREVMLQLIHAVSCTLEDYLME